MRAVFTIASNTFLDLLRQPVFLLLTTSSPAFIIILSGLPYFALGDDPKLVRDSALAVTLLCGLLGAVLTASASVTQEIRTGTALAVLSKPVNRLAFLAGKYLGIAGAMTLLTYANILATLLASRGAYDAYGNADLVGIGLFFGGVTFAYAIGAFTNYFHHRNYTADTVFALVFNMTAVFILLTFFIELRQGGSDALAKVDWRILPAGTLILIALFILAGIALACSTRLDTVPSLVICTLLFLFGLTSDYFFGRAAANGAWWGTIGHSLLPNWQLFWITDAIEGDRTIEGIWTYVGKSTGYMAGYLGAALVTAYCLFDDRDLNSEQ